MLTNERLELIKDGHRPGICEANDMAAELLRLRVQLIEETAKLERACAVSVARASRLIKYEPREELQETIGNAQRDMDAAAERGPGGNDRKGPRLMSVLRARRKFRQAMDNAERFRDRYDMRSLHRERYWNGVARKWTRKIRKATKPVQNLTQPQRT